MVELRTSIFKKILSILILLSYNSHLLKIKIVAK